jgi:hypothetical protein
MNKRTTISFSTAGDFWPVVEAWAKQNDYRLVESNGSGRVYQKGHGFLTAPMMLKIGNKGQDVALEAWIKMNMLTRACALFMLPAEMGIESGGFRAVVPRNIARTATNKLLVQFGQQQIP